MNLYQTILAFFHYDSNFAFNVVLPEVARWVAFTSVIWLPIIAFEHAWHKWEEYVRLKWNVSVKKAVLEIRLPRETNKSPKAMELVLNAIHNTSDGNWLAQYWRGESRPQYSLELISIEGKVKFLIWLEERRKGGLMAALYSQYPGVEIHEVEDYASKIKFDPKVLKLWACEFKLTKPDPYPIKTYVDYGLDKDPKEEYKVDPLTPLVEWLGSVGKDQQVWFQFIVRAHKKEQKKEGTWFGKHDAWKTEAEQIINDIMKRDPKTKVSGSIVDGGILKPVQMSEAEKDVLTALSRSLSKPAFDVGIRGIYISKKELFNTPFGIGGIIGGLKHFNTENLNGFAPNGDKWIAQFGFPWQDFKNIRRNRLSRLVLQAYRTRCYFWHPFKGKPMILNTEELATVYHLPGSVAATPGLERIPSKRADAPSNLPV